MAQKIVDISVHNGDVSFSKLKKSVDGVMIRAGYGWYHVDKKFKRNVQGCIDHNIPFGIYFYSYATTMDEARKEMDLFIPAIRGYKPTLPVSIDQEDADGYKKKHGNPSMARLAAITLYECKRLEAAGYYASYYCSTSWYDRMIKKEPGLKNVDLWLAHWGISKPSRSCGMWQYTSDGSVSGISGRCDLNLSYKDYPSIIKGAGLNGWPKLNQKASTPKLKGEQKMAKYIISYINDGDLANAQALLNSLPTSYLTKGQPYNVAKDQKIIQVGGPKEAWADIHLSGEDRTETLKAVTDFVAKQKG